MCGIIGYTGTRDVAPLLVRGLRRLEYRGYDSAGIAVASHMRFEVRKEVGRVADLERSVEDGLEGISGIAHTRWATHGGVTRENAHPHLDNEGRIVVVHNGIIENMAPLKTRLIAEGAIFRSETDSEILAHLIAHFYHGYGSFGDSIIPDIAGDPVAAVKMALSRVRGTWGVAVMFLDHPGMIIAARNGSPLVIGIGDGETFIASDPHALVPYTRRVMFMADGELARLTVDGVETWRLDGGTKTSSIETLEEEWGDGEQGDFPHFMLKEIHDQPEALRQCISGRVLVEDGTAKLGGLDLSPRELVDIQRVTLLGCGTSYNACLVGAYAIEQLARIPATAEIASEYRYRNPVVDPRGLHFAVSQSGETADTLGAVKEIQRKGGAVMGAVNVVGSSIARTCGRGVYLHSGPEMAVASTKAYSNMVAALCLFTLQLARTTHLSAHAGREFAEHLQAIPGLVEQYLANPGPIDDAVRWVCDSKITFFLGRGVSASVAAEGALKLMEVSYVPSIAYPSGEMKHGPIALLEKGSPVICIVPNDPLKAKTASNVQECRARGARIIMVHTAGDPIAELADVAIPVPETLEWFSPLLTVLPLQLLAYKAGLALGRDIDRPRNLAKSVTVE
ncbi:MAG: glutamine--fructose-6-phosphate transaminase (isomerizing) [Myxococcota bacterium]|nr:glutamine--fructose-6-phosphate transaminase (isomerizing) [Myxococcota bacterium]